MLDTIVIIPTILAYAFITLLIVILCFIVVYVSHRIYACIYDNLPVAHAALSAIFSIDYKDDKSHSDIALRTRDSFDGKKPKTALRIIVTLAPTYLAYVVYENKTSHELDSHSDTYHQNKIIKYYDRLSQIPIADTVTTSSSRKLRQRNISDSSTMTSYLGSTRNRSIKSVGTSITRFSSLQELVEDLEASNTSDVQTEPVAAQINEQQREAVAPALRQTPSILRPSVTFAQAINALANMKVTTEENVQEAS